MLKTVEIEAEAMMVSSIFPPAGNSRPSEQQNGGGIVLIPPRFTLFASFSGGPSAWGLGCALPRCGSRDFRISQRIPKIRTRPQSETDSDFVGLSFVAKKDAYVFGKIFLLNFVLEVV